MVQIEEIPMVSVIWEDACSYEGGRYILEAIKDYRIYNNFSIGYLINEDDKSITLASEIDCPQDDQPTLYQGIHLIPKSCIITRVNLKGDKIDFRDGYRLDIPTTL